VAGKLPLGGLVQAAECCRACPLYRDATQTVFGAGRARAAFMLIGEQPGDEEDKQGRPFVGPAGRVLDQLLDEASIDRSSLYVTNAVKHFKFVLRGKRRLHQKPKASEIKACQPWLEAEIDRVRPSVLFALGATAGAALYGSKVSVLRDRGRPLTCSRAPLCFISFHPSAVLRGPTPEDRARIRQALVDDLAAAAKHLREHARGHAVGQGSASP
jgi:uracil-DNA glycosylase family protein